MRTTIETHEAPRPAGPYSQAIRAGDFLYVSGQVPRAADGSYAPADVASETRLTLRNLAAVARAAGADLSQAVKITAYLADGEDFAQFNRAYAEFFTESPPARTTVVAGLRQVKVELDAVLYLGPS
ncbi:Rid family detoxifying hydrolase [Nostocoides sp. Soil756]|uniref:RidA family protein n=1 Tax=Nostocoides sp. Soil756 TaxID=1736399 RepID=UPI0006FC2E2D|nr:Rid family detoxifying hydrolase [Tetrasphaera sp. Soil756]KRE60789.1 reactive intermediate/imine deaminase [Tetrasphaera sp. Soil756]